MIALASCQAVGSVTDVTVAALHHVKQATCLPSSTNSSNTKVTTLVNTTLISYAYAPCFRASAKSRATAAARTFSVLEASMERSERQTLLMVSAGDLHSGRTHHHGLCKGRHSTGVGISVALRLCWQPARKEGRPACGGGRRTTRRCGTGRSGCPSRCGRCCRCAGGLATAG